MDKPFANFPWVDPNTLEGFLLLIKDKYPVIDKANFFLELNAGKSGSNIAMANLRDFVSHFCTILTDNSLTPENQRGQLSAAEEHLRRSVIESYQVALELLLADAIDYFEQYKKLVIPLQKRYRELADAPDINTFRSTLDRIKTLRQNSRQAKSSNKWDEVWENGVITYIDAFVETEKMKNVFEDYIALATKLQNADKGRFNKLLLVTAISIFINIVATIYYLS